MFGYQRDCLSPGLDSRRLGARDLRMLVRAGRDWGVHRCRLRELAPVRVNFGLVRQIAPGLHGPYTEFWFGGDKASDWMKVAGTPEDYYERMRAAGASVPDPPVSIS